MTAVGILNLVYSPLLLTLQKVVRTEQNVNVSLVLRQNAD
jgi:hypothetical protein